MVTLAIRLLYKALPFIIGVFVGTRLDPSTSQRMQNLITGMPQNFDYYINQILQHLEGLI